MLPRSLYESYKQKPHFTLEKQRWVVSEYSMNPFYERFNFEESMGLMTLEDFDTLFQDIQSKKKRCEGCVYCASKDEIKKCSHCSMWDICKACFGDMEGLCHGCAFVDQKDALEKCVQRKHADKEKENK